MLKNVVIRNPGSVRAEPTVRIYTYKGSQKLDDGESEPFVPEPAPFVSMFVTPSSYLTSEQEVEYLFTVRAIGPVPKNAFVYLTLPEEVKVYNEGKIQRDCEDYYMSGLPD